MVENAISKFERQTKITKPYSMRGIIKELYKINKKEWTLQERNKRKNLMAN